MDSVYGDSPPPFELKLGWQCERYRCLPDTGAYFDQDYQLMAHMTGTMNIHNALQRWRGLSGKAIHQLTDGERGILRALKDMGVMFN